MMQAANKVTDFHIMWVDVLTAKTCTYVELPTFCTSQWLIAFNFVISFYFVVSFEEIRETVALNAALHFVSLKLKYLESWLKLLDDVCKKCSPAVSCEFCVVVMVTAVYFTPELYRLAVCWSEFLLYLVMGFFIYGCYTVICINVIVCCENNQGILYYFCVPCDSYRCNAYTAD